MERATSCLQLPSVSDVQTVVWLRLEPCATGHHPEGGRLRATHRQDGHGAREV